MKKIIHGYNGPTGAYVAVDGKIKPLNEQTLTTLVNATMKTAGHGGHDAAEGS